MSISIAKLSEQLQNALDTNYNVIDMSTVLHVITVLEGLHITREQLETTRLGKYINHLRRKTVNEALARRSKNLLRKWREMILPEAIQGGNVPPVAGQQQIKQYPPIKDGSVKNSDPRGFSDAEYVGKVNGSRLPLTNQSLSETKKSNPSMSAKSKSSGLVHNNSSNCSLPASMSNVTTVRAEPTSFANLINRSETKKPSGFSSKLESYGGTIDFEHKVDDRSHSPALVPSLSKIPKKRPPPSITKNQSPLRSQSQPVFTTIIDDDTVQYDMQDHMRRFDRIRDKRCFGNLGENSSLVADNNSDSSSTVCASITCPTTGIVDKSLSINANELATDNKRKHKKHKKEKKKKKNSKNSILDTEVTTLELPESLSSSSISLLCTNNPNKSAVYSGIANTFSTSLSAKPSEFTFIGKFSKTDETVINIDSSSCSNSPKYDNYSNKVPARHTLSPTITTDIASKLLSQNDRPPRFPNEESIVSDVSLTRFQSTVKQTPSGESSQLSQYALTEPSNLVDTSIGFVNSNTGNNIMDTSSQQLASTPGAKKRGRKKGSKGVDGRLADSTSSSKSLLPSNSQYNDSVSLLSLKNKMDSMRGATKKVKTTKELLADLQNRKIASVEGCSSNYGSQTSSPIFPMGYNTLQQQQLQRSQTNRAVPSPSTCSENSQQSHTNSTADLRSTTATPASASPENHSIVHSEQVTTSVIDKLYMQANEHVISKDEQDIKKPNALDDSTKLIENEISELRSQLVPLNTQELLSWHEETKQNTIACTCVVKEIENPDLESTACAEPEESVQSAQPLQGDAKLENASDVTSVSIDTKPILAEKNQHLEISSAPLLTPSTKKPAIKSIFDLDYEEDEDPIHSFKSNNNIGHSDFDKQNIFLTNNDINMQDISELTPANDKSNEHNSFHYKNGAIKLVDDVNETNSILSHANDLINDGQEVSLAPALANIDQTNVNLADPTISAEPPPAIQQFVIEEDENCKAKNFYITSRTEITKFHIEELHNSCIPNVNGNWDDGNVKSATLEDTKSDLASNDTEEMMAHGLYKRVVPLCNYVTMDLIPKNLKHIAFDPNRVKKEAPICDEPTESPESGKCKRKLKCKKDSSKSLVSSTFPDEDAYSKNLSDSENVSTGIKDEVMDQDTNDTGHIENEVKDICFSSKSHNIGNNNKDKKKSVHSSESTDRKSTTPETLKIGEDEEQFTGSTNKRKFGEISDSCKTTSTQLDNTNISQNSDSVPRKSKKRKYHSFEVGSPKLAIKYKVSNDVTDYGNSDNVSGLDYTGDGDRSSFGSAAGKTKIILKLSRQFTTESTEDINADAHLYDEPDDDIQSEEFGDNLHDCVDSSTSDDSSENSEDDVRKIYEDETSNHFITLKNFDTHSESSPDQTESNAETEDRLNDFEAVMDDVNIEPSINHTLVDEDSDTVNNVLLFCNPIIEEGKSQSNSFNPNDCPPSTFAVPENLNDNCTADNYNYFDSSENAEQTEKNENVRKCHGDTVSLQEDDTKTQCTEDIQCEEHICKRERSTSLSSTSSMASSSSSSSKVHQTKKKKQKRKRRRPCPRHYRRPSTYSSSSSSSISTESSYNNNALEINARQTDISPENIIEIPNNSDVSAKNTNICDAVNDLQENEIKKYDLLPIENNGLLPSFNNLTNENETGLLEKGYKFKEWYEVVRVKSYNDELLTILPYVVID